MVAAIARVELEAGSARAHRPAAAGLPRPRAAAQHGPARVVAVCNQKGGVGKTTTTINLGAALAEQGRRVLLVDFDPQGALSVGLGIQPHELDATIYNLLMERGRHRRTTWCSRPAWTAWTCCPATSTCPAPRCSWCTRSAASTCSAACSQPVLPEYDVILIDCQPSLGLLTVNALACADGVIVPLECEYFALRGVALLMETIDKVSSRLNPQLGIDGLLATMYDSRTLHTREVLAERGEGLRRQGVPHGDQPHRAVPGRHRGRRADHQVRPRVQRRQLLPAARQGGAGPVAAGRFAPRPGRPAAPGEPAGCRRTAPAGDAGAVARERAARPAAGKRTRRRSPCTCPPASCSTWNAPGSRCAPTGLPWTGAGMVREAIAVLLADLDAEGEASLLARRLRETPDRDGRTASAGPVTGVRVTAEPGRPRLRRARQPGRASRCTSTCSRARSTCCSA